MNIKKNTEQEKINSITSLLLQELIGDYWIKENIKENIEEEIDKIQHKKIIYIIREKIEKTEGIEEVQEKYKTALLEIEDMNEKDFKEVKENMKLTIEYIKNEKNNI